MNNLPAPDECAVCGASIPCHARACPDCGADEKTGWREQSVYDGLDLPDKESFEAKPTRTDTATFWKVTCILLVILFVVMIWHGL